MKTVLLMTISPNGLIARKNDEAPWSTEEFARCMQFVAEKGNVIVGSRTYELMRDGGDFDPDVQTVVITRTPKESEGNVTFVPTAEAALEFLEGKGFKTVVVGGGSATNAVFLEKNLIDEIVLDIEPQVLGSGLPFANDIQRDVRLKLLEIREFGNTVQLHYQVLK